MITPHVHYIIPRFVMKGLGALCLMHFINTQISTTLTVIDTVVTLAIEWLHAKGYQFKSAFYELVYEKRYIT